MASERPSGLRGRAARADANADLVATARLLRRLLPGEGSWGAPDAHTAAPLPHRLGQQLADLKPERPSVLREVGLGALQAWQALSDAQRRRRGASDAAILFTDLVGTPPGRSRQATRRASSCCSSPRKVRKDYLGVDVNIAARVGDAARQGEVLVSEPAREQLDPGGFRFGRRRRLKAAGAPEELVVCPVRPVTGR